MWKDAVTTAPLSELLARRLGILRTPTVLLLDPESVRRQYRRLSAALPFVGGAAGPIANGRSAATFSNTWPVLS